jgi:hypothetical protein
MTSATIITLEIPATVYLISLVMSAVTIYKAKGLMLWLLITLNISILSFASVAVFGLIAEKRFIEASPENVLASF